MNRIETCFQDLLGRDEKALIAYICAGDPSLSFTKKAVEVLEKSGVDAIELGLPFSDPLADGPTIQRASTRAIKGGTKIEDIFQLVQEIRMTSQIPLLFMGYYQSLYHYGVEKFVGRCEEVGLDGLIIPDLPPEEGGRLKKEADMRGIATVFLLSPTSTQERMKKVIAITTGFIYCVSVTGVTGVREGSFYQLEDLVSSLKKLTSLPLAVGFGISTPQQARDLSALTQAIIVGSAFVKIIEENLPDIQGEDAKALKELGLLAQDLKKALLS